MKEINLTTIDKTKRSTELLSVFDSLEADELLMVRSADNTVDVLEEIASLRPDELSWSMVDAGPKEWVTKVFRSKKWNAAKGSCCGCGCG